MKTLVLLVFSRLGTIAVTENDTYQWHMMMIYIQSIIENKYLTFQNKYSTQTLSITDFIGIVQSK